MTDLEMIAEARAEAEREAAEYIDIPELHRKGMHLLELAETGALLAKAEAKWPHPRYDIHISRNDEPGPTWSVTIEDYAEEHGCGEGETFPAALRDLLGVDGG